MASPAVPRPAALRAGAPLRSHREQFRLLRPRLASISPTTACRSTGSSAVRVVNNDTDLNAILITNGVQTPTQGHRNELDYLPSLDPALASGRGVGRAPGGGQTDHRARIRAIEPGDQLSRSARPANTSTFGAGSGGNSDLDSIKTFNLDASVEDGISTMRARSPSLAFYRQLDGYIQTYANIEFFPTGPGGALQSYLVSRPRNTNEGSLKGVEIAYQQFFDFLPSPLDGFGVQANFTYADGEVEAPPVIGPADRAPADHAGFTLFDEPGCDLREIRLLGAARLQLAQRICRFLRVQHSRRLQ